MPPPEFVITYKVADNHLALSVAPCSLGGSLLSRSSTALLRCLLNTANRRCGCGSSCGTSETASATATSDATLGGENLVERLVKLAGHIDSVGL